VFYYNYYGFFTKGNFSFYLRDQYGAYKSSVTFQASLHKRMEGYEIWYFDRKYHAAGYGNSNENGENSDTPPTLPSPPSELSEFTYFSKDDDGKYHLKIDDVLTGFKTKLKEKYKLKFLGIDDKVTEGQTSGEFQTGILTSIEEVENADPFSVEVEHRFDIFKGDFRSPSIQVENTELVFDYQKWFDADILYVIRCILLFTMCVEFFFMTLKLFF
jgi:hypothetical protein